MAGNLRMKMNQFFTLRCVLLLLNSYHHQRAATRVIETRGELNVRSLISYRHVELELVDHFAPQHNK